MVAFDSDLRLFRLVWTRRANGADEAISQLQLSDFFLPEQRTIVNPFGKTRAARRKLTMTGEVWMIMKKRVGSSDSKYVFPSPDNSEAPIGSVRKAHDGAVRRAKVKPAFRLYDLRHTYASRAVMAGVDLPTLGALLGHTTIQMTMRYVHPAEEHKKEAATKIENFKALSAIKLAEERQGVPTISTTLQ